MSRYLIVLTLFLPLTAAAEYSLGGKFGTTGAGLEGFYHFDEHFVLRGAVNGYAFEREVDINGNDYDVTADMKSVSLQMDIFPKGRGFYLTGGLFIHQNTLSGDAIIVDEVGVGNLLYPANEVTALAGDLDFGPIAPYLGIGWRFRNNQPGFNFGFEAGVLFQGKGDVTLIAEGPITSTPAFLRDLELEEQDIESYLGIAKFFPVLEGRISYRF